MIARRLLLALAGLLVMGAVPDTAQALSPAGAGWFWQNPLPQGNRLEDVAMIDAKPGWAMGRGETALQTRDGGLTWTTRLVGAGETLTGVKRQHPADAGRRPDLGDSGGGHVARSCA